MSKITINGVSISVDDAKSVTIKNGRVIVDGQDFTPEGKIINIEVHGDLDHFSGGTRAG